MATEKIALEPNDDWDKIGTSEKPFDEVVANNIKTDNLKKKDGSDWNFVNESDLSAYAKTTDIENNFATKASLGDYAKTADIAGNYATKNDLDSLTERLDDIEENGTGGGMTAIINVTTAANAVVKCVGASKTYTVNADGSGNASINVNALGSYAVSAKLGTRNSLNTETVNVTTVAVYSTTISFWESELTVNTEVGAEVTVAYSDLTSIKTCTDGTLHFPIYEAGNVTVSASINGIAGETKTVNFTAQSENKTETISFIKLTVRGINGESVTVSKDSYSYNKVLDSSEETVIYLPEIGTWSCVGVGSKNGETKTKTKTVDVTGYIAYSVNVWSVVYGCYIDTNDAVESTCVHQVEGLDNYGFLPIAMNFSTGVCSMGSWADAFFIPQPCMLKYDGTVDYYLNPNDYTKKAEGGSSDIANTNYGGNAMMEFPAIFTKVVNDTENHRLYLYVSDSKEDDGYECYSCLKADGTYAEHFYLPIYEGSVISGKMRSLSGQSTGDSANITMQQQMTYAEANGSGWEINTWNDEDLMRILGVLVLGRLNTQAAVGWGNQSGGSAYTTGQGNTKGLFYGTASSNSVGIKYFGMENWWGSRYRRVAGIVTNSSNQVLVKNTHSTKDGSTVVGYNTTGNGYKNIGAIAGSSNVSGYIKSLSGIKGASTMPTVMSGASSTTYFCDYGGVYAGSVLVVGCWSDLAGLFTFYPSGTASGSVADIGASPSYHEL